MAADRRARGLSGMVDDPTPVVAAYIAAAGARDLPAEVAAKTRLHILDSIAAILSGSRLKPGRFGATFAESLGGRPEATVLGTAIVTSVVNAALANGMAGHADETDDSHLEGRFHPGCAIVPAALAIAERNGAGGEAFLRAVALGYDIGARFTMALRYASPKSAMHSTHSLGALFGSAAAAGSLLRLDARQSAWLLSYAAQQASGIPSWNRDAEHVEKAFDSGGMGARNGVYAALMVAAGATGVSDVLSGHHSYLASFGEAPDPAMLTAELGSRHEVMRTNIKKWCVGSPIQAALDALAYLIETHGLRAEEVKSLTAHMPDDRLHIVDNRDIPDISLQHLLAVMLIDGTLTFQSSHEDERMHDPAVLAMRGRIRALPSAELTVARPARQAIILVETLDGRVLERRTFAVLGTPDNPMSQQEVEAKADDLMAPVIGAERSRLLIERLRDPEGIADMGSLRPLLSA